MSLTTAQLVQLIDPDTLSLYLALAKQQGLVTRKWRLASTGSVDRGMPFSLRSDQGDMLFDFPTIPVIQTFGWLSPHLLIHTTLKAIMTLESHQ